MSNETTRRTTASIALLVSGLLFTSSPVFPQTVAEAARQERERKNHAAHAVHVYTNEDLKRPEILVPEDRTHTDAAGEPAQASATPGPETAPNSQNDPALAIAPRDVVPQTAKGPASFAPGAAPNVDSNAFVPDSGLSLATAVPDSPQFPLSKAVASPRMVDREAVPIPVVNLPMQILNATPLADPKDSVLFPMLNPSDFTSRHSASRFSAVPAPVVPYAGPYAAPQGLPVSPQQISIAVPAELAATPWLATPRAEHIATVEPPAMPPAAAAETFVTPYQISLGAPADFVSAPWLAAPKLAERIAGIEPPAMPPVAAPTNPAATSFDTPAPLQVPLAPVAPLIPAELPIQPLAITPEESAMRTVVVQAGDSLWKLAVCYLGKGERWVELAKLNPQLANPGLIHPGDPVHVPVPLPQNAKQVVIRRGDTLWSVARAEFGQGLAFSCIAHANQLPSADLILAGETLVLPADCSR
ncbi:MAG TPA: LysM peptidoglycan-binding domain-containing protein [Candidatus Acidoferrales bacterium]|nr:LysM peptidoglycan-binding domain-containing protein [Candidatus Acidoferrales bacterium]